MNDVGGEVVFSLNTSLSWLAIIKQTKISRSLVMNHDISKPSLFISYLRLVDLGRLSEWVVDGDGEGVLPHLVVRLRLHLPLALRHV